MDQRYHLRAIAASLILVHVIEIAWPSVSFALTSGPSQPEMQGFSPIGNTDMVDLFSGDFSYNIPLLDVDGYPINLSYRAGVGMEQEASWVGLGWSLNPGVVERNLRGMPDDFNGDQLYREIHMRPNVSVGGQIGLDLELFGLEPKPGGDGGTLPAPPVTTPPVPPTPPNEDGPSVTVGLSLAPTFNNYDGISFSIGGNIGTKSVKDNKGTRNYNLGFNSSSHEGVQIQPSIGFDKMEKEGNTKKGWGMGFGLTMDSRQGLKQMSFNAHTSKHTGSVENNKTVWTAKRKGTVGRSWDLGSPTYTPQIPIAMKNTSVSGRFKAGGYAWGAHVSGTVGGFYSRQEPRFPSSSRSAYGYLYMESGANDVNGQLDINREKDAAFSADQAVLPLAQMTNDLFVASAQNLGGTYRAYRSQIGHVFDPYTSSTGSGDSYGAELGFGSAFKWGANVMMNSSNSWSGVWRENNAAATQLNFTDRTGGSPTVENVYFREANEAVVDPEAHIYDGLMADVPVRLEMEKTGGFDMRVRSAFRYGSVVKDLPGQVHRVQREPRGQVFSWLTHREAAAGLGLEKVVDREGTPMANTIRPDHMSQITITGENGSRNVYGIPAYNIQQTDVSFAIDPSHSTPPSSTTYAYSAEEFTQGHPLSRDQYRSLERMPAYAHSFLLTAVLSADYSDVDNIRGPSPKDLGTYTKFSYDRAVDAHQWRTPLGEDGVPTARLDRGRLATKNDDKAHVSFGSKEVWYLTRVEGRDHVALFITEDREDGLGVAPDGTVTPTERLKVLKRIELYDRNVLERILQNDPIPMKTVHFEYDYSLCEGVPNRVPGDDGDGKLTLKKVWFTYGRSGRAAVSPYKFGYAAMNPDYDPDAQDRWGQYKPNGPLTNNLFPYAVQDSIADSYASAWNLERITLPSGGVMTVHYESDDYAYVQDRPAERMFLIGGVDTGFFIEDEDSLHSGNRALMITLPPEVRTHIAAKGIAAQAFASEGQEIYFRAKVKMESSGLGHDFVSGYGRVDQISYFPSRGTPTRLRIRLERVPLTGDKQGCGGPFMPPCVSPIYRAALDHLRLNYPREAYSPENFDENASDISQLLISMASAAGKMLTGLRDFFDGPNRELHRKGRFCQEMVSDESWVRLREPDGAKKGGGHRVQRIELRDSWTAMAPGTSQEAVYTQRYLYHGMDGALTSGVATYEPMMGADENCWRRPVYYSEKVKMAPNERFYQEEPFGESLFPGASVGYAQVTVVDSDPGGVAYTGPLATGSVVNEFFTARDFPVSVDYTDIFPKRRRSNYSVLSLLGVKMSDHNHTSQGYVVETNDMHGKPKATTVYPQPLPGVDTKPVSYVRYEYQSVANGAGRKLTNEARTITPDGAVDTVTIGRHYEVLTDMRESCSINTSAGLALNNEGVLLGFIPVPFPVPLPKYSRESTKYRSAVLVKKIHRFGLLERVVAMENGSVRSTDNLAYDAHTGDVLLTRTQNDFEDPVYALTLPAYWHYEGMGPAYQNIGTWWRNIGLSGGVASGLANASRVFHPGDEIALWNTSMTTATTGWVGTVSNHGLTVMDALGEPLAGNWAHAKVIRSGRRNMLSTRMATLKSLSDPLTGLTANVFTNILDAQSVEYDDQWRTDCACIEEGSNNGMSNPYRTNRSGIWRLKREHAWLTGRVRSVLNNNTDVRRDGVYASYAPFYEVNGGRWNIDRNGWTMVREITEYNTQGQELENVDALGIYSSATFGWRGGYAKSVARNARYAQTGFEDFENGVPNCTDSHFQWEFPVELTRQRGSHTGRHGMGFADTQPRPALVARIRPRCEMPSCDLDILITTEEGQCLVCTDPGEGATSFSYEVLTGAPVITLSSAGCLVVVPSTGWHLRVTATDQENCSVTQIINRP